MTVLHDLIRARQSLPQIRQTEASECGLACLAMIACYHGYSTDLPAMRRQFSVSLKGINLKSLIAIADRMNFGSRAVQVPLEALECLNLPAILHWDLNHFVVLKSVRGSSVVIHDPARGVRRLGLQEVSDHYTGVALELLPRLRFQKQKRTETLRLSQLWSRLTGWKRTLIQLVILSVILQFFVLIGPFYMQFVIDDVLLNRDTQLLTVLALGFGIFVLINVTAEALRGHVLLHAGSLISYQIACNLFRHLIHLPQRFFNNRHMGDIVSRFASTTPIRKMLTEGVVGVLIDGMMAITTLALMFIYSSMLTFIVLIALLFLVVLRIGFFDIFRRRSEAAIHNKAAENSNFMETVRGMLSIKLFGCELDRQQIWQNRLADSIKSDIRVARTKIWFQLFKSFLFGLENVLVIFLGAKLVLNGSMSIGMLFAFMSYKLQFVQRASALVDHGIEFRMLSLHLDRLADIALADPEANQHHLKAHVPLRGRVELRNIRFSYAEHEPEVIRDVSLVIEPGENVALTGPSGCGKTTLVAILLGLLKPQAGDILIDNLPLNQFGVRSLRSQTGCVMQDDQLFSGSISDNIAFFDPSPDQDRIMACARAAGIHREIMAMTMQYETLIGDMGTVLSGGQKQRVLLARALYRRPRMLILDEGTSHLDTATEAQVNATIRSMGMTRIIIAHRPETIHSADRVLVMKNGRIVEDNRMNDIPGREVLTRSGVLESSKP